MLMSSEDARFGTTCGTGRHEVQDMNIQEDERRDLRDQLRSARALAFEDAEAL